MAIFCLGPASARAADTNVLPKGVRALVYRHVWADVGSYFNPEGTGTKPYALNQRLDASFIGKAIPDAAVLLDQIREVDPILYSELDAGAINLKPNINVEADVFALGYGFGNDTMMVAAIPVLKASVNLDGGYVGSDRLDATIQKLKAYAREDRSDAQTIKALADILEGLPRIDGSVLQGALVNELNYKPVGDWAHTGIGDANVYLQKRLVTTPRYRHAMLVGTSIPTGQTNDPDNLLDITFGKGHWAGFIETLHDFKLTDQLLLVAQGKFQYNFKAEKVYRLFTDPDLPLSDESELIQYKPGNSFRLFTSLEYTFTDDWTLAGGYELLGDYRDKAIGNRSGFDYSILTSRSNDLVHNGTFTLAWSSVRLFKAKRFPLPFVLRANYTKALAGVNADRLDTFHTEIEMYF